MRVTTTALMAALVLGAAACSDDSPSGVSSDETAVQQALGDVDPGYFDENPGGDSLTDVIPASPVALNLAPGDPYVAPAAWGRHRRQARPARDRVIVIEGDTARVAVAVRFNGVLLVDSTHDDVRNPGHKPFHETLRHHAVLVRDSAATHGWRLVGMSIGNIVNTAPDERTVRITSMAVSVNGTQVGVLTDPSHIFPVDGVPQLHVGDSVSVTVAVDNTTGTDLAPPTQVFLHVRHCRENGTDWVRIHMLDNGDGTFTIGWRVRRPGIGRMAVDALDSETLQTQTGDNYRANLWAFPYRAVQ